MRAVNLAKATKKAPDTTKKTDATASLKDRASQELVIAFMGAVGCGMPNVITKCEDQLKELGYNVVRIKLSDFIKQQIKALSIPITPAERGVRYLENQTGGNFLRKEYGHEILAEYAINQIGRHRLTHDKHLADLSKPVPRVAYVIDQLKHPAEARLLRLVYRKLFYLIGIMSTGEHRTSRLTDEGLTDDQLDEVMRRDRKESEKHGQQLEGAFKLADYFVQHPLGNQELVKKQLLRFLNLIHGDNSITPTKHEYGMYVAHSTALKSGCLSRQVGAAIADAKGRIIAAGTNDVPQYGGGLYCAESQPDHRCFKRGGQCENVDQKRQRKERIREGLVLDLPDLFTSQDVLFAVSSKLDQLVDKVFEHSGIPDLIEFSRAVHAEMDAIVAVSRSGGGSTVGASLYTTTLPCHNCARHIVAAGIDRVYYIEPYEKSLALKSHDDAIAILDHDDENDERRLTNKVKFIHFSGVTPRLYPELFIRQDGRKDDDGRLVELGPAGADSPQKIVKEYLDSYRTFELKVASLFDESFPSS